MCRTKIISLTYPKTSDSVKLSSYLAEIKNWMYKDVLLLNNNSLYFLKQIKLLLLSLLCQFKRMHVNVFQVIMCR